MENTSQFFIKRFEGVDGSEVFEAMYDIMQNMEPQDIQWMDFSSWYMGWTDKFSINPSDIKTEQDLQYFINNLKSELMEEDEKNRTNIKEVLNRSILYFYDLEKNVYHLFVTHIQYTHMSEKINRKNLIYKGCIDTNF